MPETTRQWVIFVVGLCIFGVLFASVISDRGGSSGSPGGPTSTRTATSPTTTRASKEVKTFTTRATVGAPRPSARPKSHPATGIALTAARGDSWLIVRANSANGTVLYQGILAQGQTIRRSARRLWLRVGAGANLDARVNGRSVRLLAGTFTALVSLQGLRFAS
jgi:hypothetical protein